MQPRGIRGMEAGVEGCVCRGGVDGGGGVGQGSFVKGVSSLAPFTPGVFHKECVITAFVGFSSCNGSGGTPC